MKFTNIRVMNFENAFRGMRNPKESYHLSDSKFGFADMSWDENDYDVAEEWLDFLKIDRTDDKKRDEIFEKTCSWLNENGILHHDNNIIEYAYLGPKDLKLAQQLIKGGSEHRKFLRQIFVSVDITAPLYWWKEFDTYKVGTTANSTSTMHKIQSKPITFDCFEMDDFCEDVLVFDPPEYDGWIKSQAEHIIEICETLRLRYNETKEYKYWKELIRWLPESWLQTRTVTMNYENVLAMIHQRRFHKLDEWSGDVEEYENDSFIKFARTLPYANLLLFLNEEYTCNSFPVIDFL